MKALLFKRGIPIVPKEFDVETISSEIYQLLYFEILKHIITTSFNLSYTVATSLGFSQR